MRRETRVGNVGSYLSRFAIFSCSNTAWSIISTSFSCKMMHTINILQIRDIAVPMFGYAKTSVDILIV